MEKTKCKVCFKHIEIYYFSRCLGIDKVPERGNNPLGMECIHFKSEKVDITEKKLKNIHSFSDKNQLADIKSFCTSTPKPSKIISFRDDDQEDNESVHSVISIDYTRKSLQPLNPVQRKKCLENSGIDISKNEESSKDPKLLSKLREDRKQVGCKCSNVGKCDVNKCICSIEGVPCQSDGNKFPCKCGDKCSNASGKRIYSYVKIKFHYHHTLNRNMCLNEEVNIDALSTISGDCSICGNIPDEVWKHYPETFHQTRASKRAGGKEFQNVKLFKKLMALDENFLPSNVISTVAESDGFSEVAISCITFDSDKEQCINNDEQKTLNFVVNSNPINDKKISITYEAHNFSPGNNIDKENINFSEVLIKKTKKNNSEINSKHEFSLKSFSSKILFRCERPIKTNSPVVISNTTLSNSQEKFNSETVPFIFSSLDYYPNDTSDIHKSFITFNSGVVLPLDLMNSPNAFNFNPILLTPDTIFSIITKNSENKISINQNKLQTLSNIRDIDLTIERHERDYLRTVVGDNTRSDTVKLFNSQFSTKSIESSSLFSMGRLMSTPSKKKVYHRSTNIRSKSDRSQLMKTKVLPSTSNVVISDIDNVLKTSQSFSCLKRLSNYLESPEPIDHKNKNTRKKLIELNKLSESSNAISSKNSILNQIPLKNKLFRYSDEITFFDIPYQTIDDEMASCEKEVD